MAFIDCHFYSDSLGVSASMHVILPQAAQNQIGLASAVYGVKHPTLYLLHGLSDDHTIWMRRTSIERYASQVGDSSCNACRQSQLLHRYGVWAEILDIY